jgi:two-component system phosphate regulon sensor histidine kinase PhoR
VNERFLAVLRSFRLRLLLGYALALALVAGAWAWSLYGPVRQAAIDQQRRHLQSVAQVGVLALKGDSMSASAAAASLADATGMRVTLVAADGTLLADSAHEGSAALDVAAVPELAAAFSGRVGADTRAQTPNGASQTFVAVPVTLGGARIALRVSEQAVGLGTLAEQAGTSGLVLLAGALLLALTFGLRLETATSESAVGLRSAAEAMAAGDLRVPVPEADGELAELALALAALRDRMRVTIGELEGGQATLRAVLDGLQDAVFVFENGLVTIANRAASEFFRAPAAGWKGVGLAQMALPASLAAAVRSRISCESPCSGEVGPDPEARYYRVTAVPLNPVETGARTLVVISETTEVRRLDAVRRDFVANASHELKTPAAAIQLLADAADSAASDDDMSQALEFVQQMRTEADRLRRLVVDLLALSRLETAPIAGSITEMRSTIGNALAGHRAAVAAAGLTLQFDGSAVEDQDVYVAADPTDVAVALDNLLANAVAYTDSGGVAVRLTADDHIVSVEVRDTGVGIPREHLSRIFERFYRVDAARTRASGGTGLGLSLVRNAVERSGGTVDIASEVGVGTTITLRLPRAR